MKKIIFLIILNFNLPLLYAQNRSNMALFPLCYETISRCSTASTILKLPMMGNFWVASMCRPKNQGENARNICPGTNIVLGIEAFIDLQPSFFQWRNQCLRTIDECNQALIIWKQLTHPMGIYNFYAECGPFHRELWKMNNAEMEARGIFTCTHFDPVELRIKATRVK